MDPTDAEFNELRSVADICAWVGINADLQNRTVDRVYSETQILLATLRTQNQPQEEFYVIFGSRTFLPLQLDVQEANVSIPQFYRITDYFVGCWVANGRATCSCFLVRGDRSPTFIEEYRITNP